MRSFPKKCSPSVRLKCSMEKWGLRRKSKLCGALQGEKQTFSLRHPWLRLAWTFPTPPSCSLRERSASAWLSSTSSEEELGGADTAPRACCFLNHLRKRRGSASGHSWNLTADLSWPKKT